jgi:hypothetical protein
MAGILLKRRKTHNQSIKWVDIHSAGNYCRHLFPGIYYADKRMCPSIFTQSNQSAMPFAKNGKYHMTMLR